MEEEPQAAVIADVATDPAPPPMVLEEAVGRINEMHVVVPVVEEDGTIYLQVAKGGVFAYYEFPWPMSDRLTDEKWRQMLEEGTVPPPPAWTESFFTDQGESSDLTAAIQRFQKSMVNAVWFLEDNAVSVDGAERLRDQIDALREEKRFESHRLMLTDLRSIDRQAEDQAMVAVRETWRDELYAFDDYPGEPAGEPLSIRGPYGLDVTYTLSRDEQGWQVTRVVYANEPPAW
jgi:hypothetical protein